MADILVQGLSHYPPLAGPDERMAIILKWMLQNPKLTPEQQDPQNWPDDMRAEWSTDDGASAAAAHRAQMVAWNAKIRADLDSFDPDFVVIWGDDQYENFREDVIPAFCVNAHQSFTVKSPAGNIWGEDISFEVPGHVEAAKMLTSGLIGKGFDAAYSYRPLHHPLGHAFANALLFLDYDRSKPFRYPIIPISINCYGRQVICQRGGIPDFKNPLAPEQFDPPGPTPKRMFDLGAEIARVCTDSPYRVALVASSSWSHAFLTAKTDYLQPDTAADMALYGALERGDYGAWRNYPPHMIEECGQQEVLNWMCAAGALEALGRTPSRLGIIKTSIFNSTKVFMSSAPSSAV